MPKDLTVVYHLLDLLAITVGRKFDIDVLSKYPQVDIKKLEEAAKHNEKAAEILKQIRRELEKEK